MKKILLLSVIGIVLFSCKSKKDMGNSGTDSNPGEKSQTTGIVSHQYRPACSTVIIVAEKGSADSIVLIPKDKLGEFDKDGLVISFNYRTLRMPNPDGCIKGIPAEISDISKK
jgi:hypothetical protein